MIYIGVGEFGVLLGGMSCKLLNVPNVNPSPPLKALAKSPFSPQPRMRLSLLAFDQDTILEIMMNITCDLMKDIK